MTGEPIELALARIEAHAELAAWKCPHCSAQTEALAVSEGGNLVRAVGITHEFGCPDWVSDE